MKVGVQSNCRKRSFKRKAIKNYRNWFKQAKISYDLIIVAFQAMTLLLPEPTLQSGGIQKHDFTDYRNGPSMSSNARVCKNGDNSAVPYWFKSGTTFSINILGSSTTTNQ